MIRKQTLFFITFLLAATFLSCSNKTPLKKVKIGLSTWVGYFSVYVAKEKGYFEGLGIDVELKVYDSFDECFASYLGGNVDGVFAVLTSAITSSQDGRPAKVVQIMDYSTDADVVVGRSSYKTISELKGKEIGIIGFNSFSHMMVYDLLSEHGIKESEMRFKRVDEGDVIKLLDSGIIEAGHTWEPWTTEALRKGYKIIGRAGDVKSPIFDVLMFSDEFISKNADAVQAVVESISRAVKDIQADREAYIEIMAKYTNMTGDDIRRGLDGVHLFGITDNVDLLTNSNSQYYVNKIGEKIVQFLKNRGQYRIKDSGSVVDRTVDKRFIMNAAAKMGDTKK